MSISKFAFIAHPLSIEHFLKILDNFGSIASKIPRYILKDFLRNLPPYKFVHLRDIKSSTGQRIEGYIIMCPLTPDQLVSLRGSAAKYKVISACKLAKKMGAQIIGLGGFSSIVTNGGEDLINCVDTPITNGNTLTSCLAVDSLIRAAELMGFNLKNTTIAVIGATGDIGSICADYLSNYIAHIILVARREDKLEQLKEYIIRRRNIAKVEIIKDIKVAIQKADMILTATSAMTTIIEPQDLKPGTVLCDVSYPANINIELASKRKDVLVYEGGLAQSLCLAKVNRRARRKINLFNFQNTLHGCISETMLLALEKRFESFSLGRGNITTDKINEIRKISLKHGFQIAPFLSGGKILSIADIENIKEASDSIRALH